MIFIHSEIPSTTIPLKAFCSTINYVPNIIKPRTSCMNCSKNIPFIRYLTS